MPDSQRLITDFTSWYWWLTAVGMAIGVNLASAYLKEPIDRMLAKWLSRRQAIQIKTRAKHAADAQLLVDNPSLLALEIRSETVCLLIAAFLVADVAVAISLFGWLSAHPSTNFSTFLMTMLFGSTIGLVVVIMRVFSRALEHADRIAYVRHILRPESEA